MSDAAPAPAPTTTTSNPAPRTLVIRNEHTPGVISSRRMSNESMLGGHAAALAIKAAGVRTIFTLCGGHICALYDGCVEHGIDVVDLHHEQAAVHAADAWARLTRGLGVAVVTAGPGVTDAVTGVVAAYFAQSPVLVIAGAPKQQLMGRGTLQEMDQAALFEKYTKAQFVCTSADRVSELVSQAAQIAQSGVPGPVFVEIPFDVMVGTTTVVRMRTEEPSSKRLPQAADYPAAVEKMAALVAQAEEADLVLRLADLVGRRRRECRGARHLWACPCS